jgi:glycosyltransferase involved in cell wall biosynthesis
MMQSYSVLMSVYFKEKPEYLEQAIESIQAQTLQTDDFVLVCDGPLNDALDKVIVAKQQEMGTTLNVVRLAKNGGLGNALNEGIKRCKNELVARMDSDDIAYSNRCERQLDHQNIQDLYDPQHHIMLKL